MSAKVQMNFELGFPKYLIGKCCCTAGDVYEIRTKKVTAAQKGLVISDTIPLGWFTSSVFIPWTEVQGLSVSGESSPKEDLLNDELVSELKEQPPESEYATIRLSDPVEMTIDFPWAEEFTDCIRKNKLFDI